MQSREQLLLVLSATPVRAGGLTQRMLTKVLSHRFASAMVVVCTVCAASPAYGAPGDLDASFSSDGFAPLNRPDRPYALDEAADGSLLVAGEDRRPGSGVLSVARYSSSGELDRTFGEDGSVQIEFGENSAANAVIAMPDGSVLVSGFTRESDDRLPSVLVAKLRPDGTPDPSFGTAGVASPDVPGFGAGLNLDSQERLVLLGEQRVMRLRSDGRRDNSFSGDGVAAFSEAHPTVASLGTSDAIFVAGLLARGDSRAADDIEVLKITESGELDPSFGVGGQSIIVNDTIGDDVVRGIEADRSDVVNVAVENCFTSLTGPGGGTRSCELRRLRTSSTGQPLPAFDGIGGEGFVFAASEGREFAAVAAGIRPIREGYPRYPGTAGVRPYSLADGSPQHRFGLGSTAYVYRGIRSGHFDELTTLADRGVAGVFRIGEHQQWLVRLEGAGAQRDFDADGRSNAMDGCDLFASKRSDGCPRIPRGVSLTRGYERESVYVQVSAPLRPCVSEVRVRVLRKRRGPDVVLATRRTQRGGAKLLDVQPRAGMYASVARHTEAGFGVCNPATSGVIQSR